MPRSQSDLSNTAIRIFLQEVGNFYDKERGLDIFKPTAKQKQTVYSYFGGCCAYCGVALDRDLTTLDHLIPLNKTSLGLHAWGNLVACRRRCNKEKHFKYWVAFLQSKAVEQFQTRKARIDSFVAEYKYDPELGLLTIAQNLYQDVGEVGMTLVRIRLKQAQETIRGITTRKS